MSVTALRPTGLTTRLLVFCLGFYLLIAALATVLEVGSVLDQTRRASEAEMASLAKTFTPPLESALWTYDETQLGVLLDVLAEIPSVGRVRLTSAEGQFYERSQPQTEPSTLGDPMSVPLFHYRDDRKIPVGELVLEPSTSAAQKQALTTLTWAFARTSVVVILLSAILIWGAQRMVGRPLRNLAEQISAIDPRTPGAGSLVPDTRTGAELVQVTQAFNRLLAELLAVNASLETKVAQRTVHLERTIQELSSTRDKLVDSAKLAVLGQLVAGVAHDLNTPLGAALSSSNSALDLLVAFREDLNRDPLIAGWLNRAADPFVLRQGHFDPQNRRGLIRDLDTVPGGGDYLEALEELGVHPPLAELVPLLESAPGRQALDRAHRFVILARSCRIMGLSSEKMASVVENLLRYSRKDVEALPQPSDLSDQLETLLVLFSAALKGGVTVVRNFEPIPLVVCHVDRIQQVWINLVNNALQAMEGRGTLELGIRRCPGGVEVTVANDGPPIPEAIAAKLFTPFFTTKPRGSGTGLGLSICQRIVEEHGGDIGFVTRPGRTVFTVRLPNRILSSPSAS